MNNANCLSKYATEGEQRKARRIIAAALAAGYTVSVCDGEEWTVKRSANKAEILDALATTDSDTLRIRTASGDVVGSLWLIWGNARDGSELAADYTSNEETAKIANA